MFINRKRPYASTLQRAATYTQRKKPLLMKRPNRFLAQRTRTARRLRNLNVRSAGFLGLETKFYDTSLADAAISVATDASGAEVDPSTTSMISTPAVGDSEQNRDGKKIVARYAEIKGIVNFAAQANQVAADEGNCIMVALVLDTQTNGAQMNSEDCFKNVAAVARTNASPLRNLLFGSRFRVLRTEVFEMNTKALTYDGTNIEQPGIRRPFSWYVPLKNLTINFNAGTTASVANVVDNSLHMIAYSTAPDCYISYNARLRFVG